MLMPGPDHPITITKHPKKVRVVFNGKKVAESANALKLQEADYPYVFYIPREDARMEHCAPSNTTYRCPYKGFARYFSLEVDGKTSKDAVWSFTEPNPCAEPVRNHLAFYTNRIDAITELD
jgi:uncharacterized protein (DUF427 family)